MQLKLFQMNKRQCLATFLITLVVTFFRIMLQMFIPSSGTSTLEPSIFVKAGLLPLVFTIFAFVVYGALAILFFVMQDNLSGASMKKGLVFGASFGMMWFIYLLEPIPYVFEQALLEFLLYPIADSIALLLLGLLLGKFIATDTKCSKKVSISYSVLTVAAITLFFVLARYLSYTIFDAYSSFATKPILTMVWTIAIGICLGIMYMLLSSGITVKSIFLKAVYFGIIVIGIDLFLFNCFVPLVFEGSVFAALKRAIFDVIPIILGIYVVEKALAIHHHSSKNTISK